MCCLRAHSFVGGRLLKLDEAELAANRAGGSTDAKADAAVRFAVALAEARGHVGESAVEAVGPPATATPKSSRSSCLGAPTRDQLRQ
ncbi:MAG: hypothetical protein R3D25_04610 [Geminicoccaceae bacterium]